MLKENIFTKLQKHVIQGKEEMLATKTNIQKNETKTRSFKRK